MGLEKAAALVADAVATKGIPGAVVLVAQHGKVLLKEAYGAAILRPELTAMRTDTIFDLASLTKPCATGMALGLLLEARALQLDDLVGKFLPAFFAAGGERAQITLRQLATHCAGLPAGGAYAGKTVTLAQITNDISQSRRAYPVGSRFLYSDFSAITLGAVVEVVARQSLDRFCRERVYQPLGMTDTGFRPGIHHAPRCASTAAENDTPRNRGVVHDPTAAAVQRAGEVTGHAGLFSTATDLLALAQCFLRGGGPIFSPETVRLLTTKQSPFAGNDRGVLWDIASDYAIRGELTPGSFGHTGFTGTSIWIDPARDAVVVLLTNSVHAKPQPTRSPAIALRRQLSTEVAHAL